MKRRKMTMMTPLSRTKMEEKRSLMVKTMAKMWKRKPMKLLRNKAGHLLLRRPLKAASCRRKLVLVKLRTNDVGGTIWR